VDPPLRPDLGPHRARVVGQLVHLAPAIPGLPVGDAHLECHDLPPALPNCIVDCNLRSTPLPHGKPAMPTFSAATLTTFAQSLFEAAGVPPADAAVVASSLVDANLCGHDSHGVMRIQQYIDFLRKGTFKPGVPLSVLGETAAVLVADGNWGLGQVQAYRLLDRLMPKAKQLGIAAGTLRNCGHVGRLGEYAEFAARERMALFAAVNSHGSGR